MKVSVVVSVPEFALSWIGGLYPFWKQTFVALLVMSPYLPRLLLVFLKGVSDD